MPLDDQTISDIRAANPGAELHALTTDDGLAVVVKMPSGPEFERFTQQLADDERQHNAMANLFHTCVVYPPAAEIRAMLAAQPGLAFSFGGRLAKVAGVRRDIDAKKL